MLETSFPVSFDIKIRFKIKFKNCATGQFTQQMKITAIQKFYIIILPLSIIGSV